MRVLHVTHNFPRWPGDHSGNFLFSLAREQVALGDEVTVLAPHAADASQHAMMSGVRVERFRYASTARETLAYTGVMHEQVRDSWRARWTMVRFLGAMRRATSELVSAWRPDVVHLHWWFPAGIAIAPTRVVGDLPVVITSHGTDLFLLRKMPALRGMARAVYRRASLITTVSHALSQELPSLGVDLARVHVAPMPLDAETFGGAPAPYEDRDRDHILFVGRLSVQKGVSDLLAAVAELAAMRPALRLTIIGDGPERTRLEELARTLGIAARVTFRGRLDTGKVAREYRAASVLAVPSTEGTAGEREGFGLVAVEAMLAGLPVVASNTGGLVDIIRNGDTGILVEPAKHDVLARALGRVLSHPVAARAMADRARADVQRRFAPSAIARQYRELYVQAGAPC